MPQILKLNFEILQRKDVKNLELWILISWNGVTVDIFYLNFSYAFHSSYVWSKFGFHVETMLIFRLIPLRVVSTW